MDAEEKRKYYRERRKRLYWSDPDFRERAKIYDAKSRAKRLSDPALKERDRQRRIARYKRNKQENPEKLVMQNKASYAKNKDERRKKSSEWLTVPTNRIRHIAGVRILDAKKNGIEVNSEFMRSFAENPPTNCPICSGVISYTSYVGRRRAREELFNSPSFDRVDPSLGYVEGNVKIICLRCNTIKNFGTSEDHRRIADYMDRHANKK